MRNTEREALLVNLNGYAEKANYLAEKIIDDYGLDCGMVKDHKEAIKFANNRENIGMDMEILCDYISNIQNALCVMEKMMQIAC